MKLFGLIRYSKMSHPPAMITDMDYGVDEHIGRAARFLAHQGKSKHVSLLLATHDAKLEYVNSWNNSTQYHLVLEIDLNELEAAEELKEGILDAVNTTWATTDDCVETVTMAPHIEVGDWRRDLTQQLQAKPTNQASLRSLPSPFISEDRIRFRSDAELAVYRVLKRFQAEKPQHETVGIMPNGMIRVPGNTWEPDFVVTYKGHVGIIEVDGPHHHGRAAADHSRDRLFENAGIRYVERIAVEDTNDAAVAQLLERFLYKLGS